MGAFSTKKTLYGDTARIPQVAEKIRQAFVNEGYEVRIEDPASGQRIFISKGGLFKAALGLRTALEVTMKPDKAGNFAFGKYCVHYAQAIAGNDHTLSCN